MAAKKFLRLVTGRISEIVGTVVSTGAPNDGDIPALDATGRLDTSLMPVGITPAAKVIVASENLSAGDFVNIHDAAGVARVRRADATDPAKYAQGFVLAAVIAPATGVVFFEDVNTSLSGLTPGQRLYLSASTPGGHTTTPPSTAGQIVQSIGVAIDPAEMSFEPQEPITVA
ncbi:MAG: hypothetical protein ACREJC_15960 [Tepidisphaeraceae bacterium]